MRGEECYENQACMMRWGQINATAKIAEMPMTVAVTIMFCLVIVASTVCYRAHYQQEVCHLRAHADR